MGADLVAICPQRPEFLKQMRDKHGLDFEILRDAGNELAEKFGLRYGLPDYLQEIYLNFGLDLPRFNGDGSWTLPMPARYVVRESGEIFAADIGVDYRYRPDPEKTLEDLKKLKEQG